MFKLKRIVRLNETDLLMQSVDSNLKLIRFRS